MQEPQAAAGKAAHNEVNRWKMSNLQNEIHAAKCGDGIGAQQIFLPCTEASDFECNEVRFGMRTAA